MPRMGTLSASLWVMRLATLWGWLSDLVWALRWATRTVWPWALWTAMQLGWLKVQSMEQPKATRWATRKAWRWEKSWALLTV